MYMYTIQATHELPVQYIRATLFPHTTCIWNGALNDFACFTRILLNKG